MGASLAFKKAVSMNKKKSKKSKKSSQFGTRNIVNFLNSKGIHTIHDHTYWQLKFKYRGNNYIISGYEEDNNFEGYLYNRKYFKTQQGVINEITRHLFYY